MNIRRYSYVINDSHSKKFGNPYSESGNMVRPPSLNGSAETNDGQFNSKVNAYRTLDILNFVESLFH